MSGLSISVGDGSPPVLHVAGDLDIANADEFDASLTEALSANPTMVVDLADLTFIDAAGMRAILRAAESRNGEGPLTLVNAPRVARLLRLVGLEGIGCVHFAEARSADVG